MSDLDKINKHYQLFCEYIYDAYFVLEDLIKNINKVLLKTSEIEINDEFILYKLECNLLYMEKFLTDIDNLIEESSNVDLLEVITVELQKSIKENNLYIIPLEDDIDIYVNPYDVIDWSKFYKKE
jgi:hypothetical protein